jgi:hypothetical protein
MAAAAIHVWLSYPDNAFSDRIPALSDVGKSSTRKHATNQLVWGWSFSIVLSHSMVPDKGLGEISRLVYSSSIRLHV